MKQELEELQSYYLLAGLEAAEKARDAETDAYRNRKRGEAIAYQDAANQLDKLINREP